MVQLVLGGCPKILGGTNGTRGVLGAVLGRYWGGAWGGTWGGGAEKIEIKKDGKKEKRRATGFEPAEKVRQAEKKKRRATGFEPA